MRTLVIPDIHEPFCLPGFRGFCKKIEREWKTNKTVFIGDIVDLHALSNWDHDPDGQSGGDEYRTAKKELHKWYEPFPEAIVIIGNHCARPFRQAYSHGIPAAMMKSYREIWGAPKMWRWKLTFEIDGVLYTHEPPKSGALLNSCIIKRQSVVFGHTHHGAGVQYHASERDLIFSMNVGAGLDKDCYAARYAIKFPNKPTIGCGVVIDGRVAHWIPMDLGARYPKGRHA